MLNYQRCSRCVMDNYSDSSINFDTDGICNYCSYALERMPSVYFPNDLGRKKLEAMLKEIKINSKDRKYDCIMGVSGGLDSSYLLYLGYKWGLRILAFHIDDGFNSEIAEQNIKYLCKKCKIDLIVERPDKSQFCDVTRSFILAGLPGVCNPQDNIITSYLYKNARKYNIDIFLSGANFSLESILERGTGTNASDGYHIKAISKKYGKKGVDKLPLISLFDRYVKIRYTQKLKILRPLDFIDYNKEKAIKELQDFSGFNYYGGKHYENILTHFVQVKYLPEKFKIDKRKSHLSSLIVSKQISRDEALLELDKPLYDIKEMRDQTEFVLGKLNISKHEFEDLMKATPKKHSDYPGSFFLNFANLARKYRKFLSN